MNQQRQNEINILLKSWETLQLLAKGNGESAWKIKSWGITVWGALVAYSFKEHDIGITYISILVLAVTLIIELSIRCIQYKYIARSIEIEISLNDILVGDDPRLPEKGVSTNLDIPELKDLINLFSLKRWLIWFPYLILFIASFALIKIFQ